MKVIDFINKFKSIKIDSAKLNVVNEIVKKDTYVDFATKTTTVRGIVSATMTDADGKFKPDSIKRFYLTTYALLDNYTELELENENFAQEYTLLDECGALALILAAIPEKEKSELNTMISMAVDDYLQSHGTFQNWLEGIVDSLSPILSSMDKLATDKATRDFVQNWLTDIIKERNQ